MRHSPTVCFLVGGMKQTRNGQKLMLASESHGSTYWLHSGSITIMWNTYTPNIKQINLKIIKKIVTTRNVKSKAGR